MSASLTEHRAPRSLVFAVLFEYSMKLLLMCNWRLSASLTSPWALATYLFLRDIGIDREMGINKAHLVLEANSDALDHVFNMRSNSANASNMLTSPVPDLYTQLCRIHKEKFDSDVFKVFFQFTARPSDVYKSRLYGNGDILWDCDILFLTNVFHLWVSGWFG